MKSSMKISTLVLALCSLFSFTSNNHDVRSVKAAKGEGDEVWSLIGSVDNYFEPIEPPDYKGAITYTKDTWTRDFNFQYNAEASQYELAFTFDEGDQFKIRKDGNWNAQIGYCGNTGGGIGDYLTNEGTYKNENGIGVEYANFKVKTAGTYLLKVADNDVANYGDRSYGFSIEKINAAVIDDYFSYRTNSVTSILITNKIEKRPEGWTSVLEAGISADQLTDDGKMVGVYVYPNVDDSTKKDVVIYANVDRIFAPTDCSYMFRHSPYLTKVEFDCFDTSRVVDMFSMFADNPKLTSLDLSMFHTPCVKDMSYLFGTISSSERSTLKSIDISSFDFSNVSIINNMFSSNYELTEIKFPKKFTKSKITTTESLFADCTSLTSLDLSFLDTSNVTNMEYMFDSCTSLTSVNLSSFDTSKVTTMSEMFDGCTKLESLDLSNFNTANVTDMTSMFRYCESLKEIKFFDTLESNTFVTDNVNEMYIMFAGCRSLTEIDVRGFNTSKVTGMMFLFSFCDKLTTIKGLDKLDTSNVTDMEYMFARDHSLKSLDLSNFNTSKVTYMQGMFYQCTALEKLDISSFDLSSIMLNMNGLMGPAYEYPLYKYNPNAPRYDGVTGTAFMFDECTSLREIHTPTTMPAEVSATLPYQYARVTDENAVKVMDSTNTKTILFPGSLELNKLLNDMYYLKTCENYDQATALRERYNALSDSDKEIFKTATDKDNVLMSAKLDYMEHMLALNSETEKNNIHIMTTINDSPSFLVVATIISSLAILGYYMIQKRKSSID